MGLIDFSRDWSEAEVKELVEGIRDGEVSNENFEELRSLVSQANDQQQRKAIENNVAINDLIDALNLPLPAPEVDFDPGPTDEQPEPEPEADVEVQEVTPQQRAEEVSRLGDLNSRFPQSFFRSQYKTLEQARQNFFPDMDPGKFYENHAGEFVSRKLRVTKEEFVAGQSVR